MAAILEIIGLPLDESPKLDPGLTARLASSDLVIGESRLLTERRCQTAGVKPEVPIFYLDNIQEKDRKELEAALQRLSSGQRAVLFSDMGMPMLFDPGREVLTAARRLGMEIRSVPGATSWGTACALSGWEPPFLIVGFPPRETGERSEFFKKLAGQSAGHLLLMDTPYRFTKLLDECRIAFGSQRTAFLGWEIGLEGEALLWGTLPEIQASCGKRGLVKGEFILLLKSV